MFKSTSLKKIAIVMENLKYGGATTHLLTLINNKKFKHTQFTIITNKTILIIPKNLFIKNFFIILILEIY